MLKWPTNEHDYAAIFRHHSLCLQWRVPCLIQRFTILLCQRHDGHWAYDVGSEFPDGMAADYTCDSGDHRQSGMFKSCVTPPRTFLQCSRYRSLFPYSLYTCADGTFSGISTGLWSPSLSVRRLEIFFEPRRVLAPQREMCSSKHP